MREGSPSRRLRFPQEGYEKTIGTRKSERGMRKRFGGLALALALTATAGSVEAGSWDERVFTSHVDFDAVAAAGAPRCRA